MDSEEIISASKCIFNAAVSVFMLKYTTFALFSNNMLL